MICVGEKNQNLYLVVIAIFSSLITIFNAFVRFLPYNSYYDEIAVVLIVVCSSFKKEIVCKEFKLVLVYLVFMLIYSIMKDINVPQAALFDFTVLLKPFICFYFLASREVAITEKIRRRIITLYLACGIYCFLLLPKINSLYSNTASYYPVCLITAVFYLLFSNRKQKDWIIAMIILLPGLASIRAKYFTEFVSFCFVAFFLKNKVRLNVKSIIIIILLAGISIYLSYEKFTIYFLDTKDTDVVRTLFYKNSLKLLMSYFPFGPGLGTFAMEGAARYYSPLYYQNGMAYVWGADEASYGSASNFLTDTFYPALAQGGVVAVFLFIYFWRKRWYEAYSLSIENYKIYLFVFLIMFVQNIADNAFTGYLCVPCMMILGFLTNRKKND